MLKIVRVTPTVGKSDVYAIFVKDENVSNLNNMITPYFEKVYGEYVNIQYIAQIAASTGDISQYKVTDFMDAELLVENSK